MHDIVSNAKNWDVGFICGVPAWIQILFERIIKNYNLKTIHDIWPNLKVFVHGGVSIKPYKPSIVALCRNPLIYIDTYMAQEEFIAFQERPNELQAMKLITDNNLFLEFVPFNENNFDQEGNLKPKSKAIDLRQVDENIEYALIITNCAGAWRYLIGDTIQFTDVRRNEIIITGRTKHFLSLCGEHLSVDNMNKAIEMASDEFNIDIREFTVLGKGCNTVQ